MIIEIELVVVEMMFERHLMLHIETQHELVELNYIIDVLNVKLDQILKLNNKLYIIILITAHECIFTPSI
jgi:hypothetical protein